VDGKIVQSVAVLQNGRKSSTEHAEQNIGIGKQATPALLEGQGQLEDLTFSNDLLSSAPQPMASLDHSGECHMLADSGRKDANATATLARL